LRALRGGQVTRPERLARQTVLADERRSLTRRRRLLCPDEALDQRRQSLGPAATHDPLEQASVLVRDVEFRVPRADASARVGQAEQVAVRATRARAARYPLVGGRVDRPGGGPAAPRPAGRRAPPAR